MTNKDTGDKTTDMSVINPVTGDKSAINNNSGNKKDNQTAINAENGDNTGDKMQKNEGTQKKASDSNYRHSLLSHL